MAFGANTPFYRFLVQSFGAVFLAIRAPSRGIVLFHIALAVLAAWGLSLLTRRRSVRDSRSRPAPPRSRCSCWSTGPFRSPLIPTPGESSAVYRWMRTSRFPGAAVEWPLGLLYDFEYVLRQTAHEKPILNGYSGFFPAQYTELETLLKKRPIPETEAWPRMRALGASVLVYHAHEGRGYRANDYSAAVRRGVSQGALELLGGFPHEGLGFDFAFRLAGSPPWPVDVVVVVARRACRLPRRRVSSRRPRTISIGMWPDWRHHSASCRSRRTGSVSHRGSGPTGGRWTIPASTACA